MFDKPTEPAKKSWGVRRENLAQSQLQRSLNPTEEKIAKEIRELKAFTMQSVDEEYVVDVNDALVGDLLTSERDIPPFLRDLSDQPHIEGIKFPEAEGGVMMIIGAAHADAAVAQEIRRGPSGSLTCFRCLFGWTVCGKTGKRGLSTWRLFLSLERSEVMKPSYFLCLKRGGTSLTSSMLMTSRARAAWLLSGSPPSSLASTTMR